MCRFTFPVPLPSRLSVPVPGSGMSSRRTGNDNGGNGVEGNCSNYE